MNILASLILFFKIAGISAASGIHYDQNQVYIIADNSPYLYHYDIQGGDLHKVQLDSSQSQESIDKKNKADFEAMYDLDSVIVVVGSGSGIGRQKAFIYHKEHQIVETVALDSLYAQMQKVGNIDDQNLNIEGISYANGIWYFLNRGNGNMHENIVFSFRGNSKLQLLPESLNARHITLPPIDGCPAGFSDAEILGDRLFFLATAEDKESNYEDGANKGSFMSYLDLNTWTLGPIRQLSDTKKLEGLSLYSRSDSSVTFLLCEDPDDETINNCPVYHYRYDIKQRAL